MKKTLTVTLALTGAIAAANASLIAGWDFSQFTTDGTDDVDFNYQAQTSLKANYSDLGASGLGSDANPFGEVSWTSAGAVVANGSNLTSGQNLRGISTKVNGFDSANVSDGGQVGSGSFSAQAGGASMTFGVTAGSSFNTLALQFGAATNDSSAGSVVVYAGTASDSLSQIGSTVALTASEDLYTVDLGSLGSASTFFVQFQGSTNALYDNVAISGTVVPEPSAFAAMTGALALGAVMVRRRRR